ncbi:MAG: hypothetical protein VKO65_04535 [Cyanobacteriota bacterium]|nr:hypothetical protein [Cyanobacteriota bacterium]
MSFAVQVRLGLAMRQLLIASPTAAGSDGGTGRHGADQASKHGLLFRQG